ncbi:serine/threonine-protein kinase pim-1-like [Xyrichtys novacula]|uniref:Serine/threonine-protein kinase pim-1-like n=1 Tax=Xyrichtys novacula TaxID=13765 RepID=A0AAV1F2P9_XYRNO|nr:serine/threonine-protein kinase pim-1-like [Xyrichtys novacula]
MQGSLSLGLQALGGESKSEGDKEHQQQRTDNTKERSKRILHHLEELLLIQTEPPQFEATYKQQDPLGEGGQGSVCAGFSRVDDFPVAIKHIHSHNMICEGVTVKGWGGRRRGLKT